MRLKKRAGPVAHWIKKHNPAIWCGDGNESPLKYLVIEEFSPHEILNQAIVLAKDFVTAKTKTKKLATVDAHIWSFTTMYLFVFLNL